MTLALRSRHTVPSALISKKPGSAEPFFNGKGELNASNKTEALQILGSLMADVASNKVSLASPNEQEDFQALRKQRQETLLAAFNDRDGSSWQELGATIGAEISEVAHRDGFMRRFYLRADLAQGTMPRLRVKYANVTAIYSASASQVYPLFVRDKYIYPPEFYVLGNIMVEQREVAQGAGDILEDAFLRAQENIMVQEDTIMKSEFDASIGVANAQQLMAGGLTPASLAAFREPIITWGLPAEKLLIAANIWTDIVGNASAWSALFDPVTRFEIVQTGYLGTLLGLQILTDAYREPNQRVLNAGEMYITSRPDMLGAYTDRGPVNAAPIDQQLHGIPARGWFFSELLSQTLANARAVVKATR